jgi:hypothetical protein
VLDHKAHEGQPRTAAKEQKDCDALSHGPCTIYELCSVADGFAGCDEVWLLQTGHIHLQSRYWSAPAVGLGAIHRRLWGNRQDKGHEARARRTSKRRQSPFLGLKLSNFLAQEIYITQITHGDACVFIVLS